MSAVDVHYGVSTPAQGFAGVRQAYREATLSLSYSSPTRPIVSLDDLSALEVAVVEQSAPTTVRCRLQQIATRTGHDPPTFAGLVDLICILEVTAGERRDSSAQQSDASRR